MTWRVCGAMLLATLWGCNCRPGPVEPIELGLRVLPAEVDFGRVLEGSVGTQTVTLGAQTRASINVELSTGAPFGVQSEVEVPGGGDVSVPVTFLAGTQAVEGTLELKVGEKTALVTLRGVGVHPLDCRPSAECVLSAYSLEEDRCIEIPAPDDAACDPSSLCLEQGRCRSGQCLGVARKCDDDDVCTDDACAMGVGCIHTPHSCPSPTAACQVATCDARRGCGFGQAPDLQPCGSVDCTEVHFCIQGTCRTQPTPEGLVCSPAIACLSEGQCHQKKCTRETEKEWVPDWSARLAGTPSTLSSQGNTLFFSLCTSAADGGSLDAGGLDGGEVDVGVPSWCGLASYTGTGFERFLRPYEDGASRDVLAATSTGVVLLVDGGLEVRSTTNGTLTQRLAFEGTRAQVALERDVLTFVQDAGLVRVRSDGGVDVLAAVSPVAALGVGDGLFAWDADGGVLTRFDVLDDGGLQQVSWNVGAGSSSEMAVNGDRVTIGARAHVRLSQDGGGVLVPLAWSDGGLDGPLDDRTLVANDAVDSFFMRCDGGCTQGVRAFDPTTGLSLWEAIIVESGTPGTIVASTLIDGFPGAVTSLVREETDAGPRTSLRLYADGERKALCRLPDGSGAVERALFSASAMVTTSRRPDGGVTLESYGLGALPVSRKGWPTVNGVGGTRTDGR